MKKIDYSNTKKILILRIGKIGDIIISSFVFTAIKKNNPKTKIYLITLDKNKDVLCANPDIDEIVFIKNNITSLPKILSLNFTSESFDLIIDLNDNPSKTSKLLLQILRGKEKLGFNFKYQSRHLTIKVEQPNKEETHLVERYAHLLRESGLKISDELVKPILYLDNNIENSIANELNKFKKEFKLVGLNISSGADIRLYPVEKWIELINKLTNKFSFIRFLVLYNLPEKKIAERILENVDNRFIVSHSGESFQHFAAKIKNVDLLITPDTSAVHICSAFQVPVIALYPNVKWNFVSFAPYKTINRSILSDTEEIKNISVEKIIHEFEDIIKELRWNV
ncbi:MAG: glycosyltransferase family 9 protein [Ignavibacteria bacterium]|nr:glycosyltransferase family 9 protein [Ignavibacteria bacterium]